MTRLEIQINRRKDIEKKLTQLYDQEINAGIVTAGEIKNEITRLEELLHEIDRKIENLQEAKLPDQLNVIIFVIANYSYNIKKFIPDNVFCKIPSDRNPNENIESWIPY